MPNSQRGRITHFDVLLILLVLLAGMICFARPVYVWRQRTRAAEQALERMYEYEKTHPLIKDARQPAGQ